MKISPDKIIPVCQLSCRLAPDLGSEFVSGLNISYDNSYKTNDVIITKYTETKDFRRNGWKGFIKWMNNHYKRANDVITLRGGMRKTMKKKR